MGRLSVFDEPWAKIIDAVVDIGYADETIQGDFANQKAFALDNILNVGAKLGLSHTHVIGSQPNDDDIYAYWLRMLSGPRSTSLVHVVSKDTGFYREWSWDGRDATSLAREIDSVISSHNAAHTRSRRRRAPRPAVPAAYMDIMGHLNGVNPRSVLCSQKLRFALTYLYTKVGVTDLRQVNGEIVSAMHAELSMY